LKELLTYAFERLLFCPKARNVSGYCWCSIGVLGYVDIDDDWGTPAPTDGALAPPFYWEFTCINGSCVGV